MDTNQLSKILRHLDECTLNSFSGVYAADRLPSLCHLYDKMYIIANLSPAHHPGTHWVAIYGLATSTGLIAEYFCSFGQKPNKQIKSWLEKYFKTYNYNKVSIQDPLSNTCGAFSLFFLTQRCRNITMRDIIYYLTTLNYPDIFVSN